jgi:transcription initiation factor TFIIE subunit beta
MDKKKILFYNDRTANFAVDEEFQKQWRAVAVESMDDAKIEDYLEKQVCQRCFLIWPGFKFF